MRWTALLVFLIVLRPAPSTAQAALIPGGKYVEVDLNSRVVRFRDGDLIIWEAAAGTGTGLQLDAWDFATPAGRYVVQAKAINPVWFRPDWWYRERDLEPPPADDPARGDSTSLGAAAVYIGDGLAIHGTNQPALVGQQVSHGCIRLNDRDALRLYHNVQVGTPVIIHGSQPPISEPAAAPPTGSYRRRDPLGGTRSTTTLIADLASPRGSRQWAEATSILVRRTARGDTTAAAALVRAALTASDEPAQREAATFLADAFATAQHGAIAIIHVADNVDPGRRALLAALIVNTLMDAYHGPLDATAPWPSYKLTGAPRTPSIGLLLEAESLYRQINQGGIPAPPTRHP